MKTLTIDDASLATLRQAAGLAAIQDSTGNVVGYFAPVAPERATLFPPALPSRPPVEDGAAGDGDTARPVVDASGR